MCVWLLFIIYYYIMSYYGNNTILNFIAENYREWQITMKVNYRLLFRLNTLIPKSKYEISIHIMLLCSLSAVEFH